MTQLISVKTARSNIIMIIFFSSLPLDGLLEDGDDFTDFRHRVMELIKDVVFIVGNDEIILKNYKPQFFKI